MSRTNLSAVVSRQLPEHIREDYPTFVAFIEAYYEYLQTQGVDFSTIRDIDQTLESFIDQFKKELSYNLPNTPYSDERFSLKNIKDLYLSKGSEASYKLLFRLLFGKEVEVYYPGQQMLRPSDGRWNQDKSIFVKVTFGDIDTIVGEIVDIEDGDRIIRVEVKKTDQIRGEVDRIVAIGNDVYEIYLDQNTQGIISPGNVVKYQDLFKATILPTTSNVSIYDAGRGFRIGQVFEIRSSTGTGTLIKVTKINSVGGIVNAQIIRFGIGYIADFTTSILPSSSLTSRTITETEDILSVITIDSGTGPLIVGVEPTINISELGFINSVDYVTSEYVDGTYSGTLLKEFSSDFETVVGSANVKPAIIEIKLNAIAEYPGYFQTNNGFLSDSIYIQDSNYYQIYSYVLKINERLSTYKDAVKTMIHPAGVALFGEFDIFNNFNLAIELESLIKSLAIGVEEPEIIVTDADTYYFVKGVDSPTIFAQELTTNNFVDNQTSVITSVFNKNVSDALDEVVVLSDPQKLFSFGKTELVVIDDTNISTGVGVSLDTTQIIDDSNITRDTSKSLQSPEQLIEETNLLLEMNDTKYMIPPIQYITETEFGYVVKDPYEEGNYFSEIYLNNRDAIFSS
jgi:hypothetical protein